MPEYIEREKAIVSLLEIIDRQNHPEWLWTDEICGALNTIPAADVRPVVKATWIVKEMQALFPGMDEHPVFVCSECGYQIYDLFDSLKERHHFCPNCGADMREEENG